MKLGDKRKTYEKPTLVMRGVLTRVTAFPQDSGSN
jgi:hypothetical protein